MEVGNADKKELDKVSFFIPTTPLKCMPAATGFNSVNAGFNNFLSTSSSDNSQKMDEEVSGVIGGRREFLSRYLDAYYKSASVAPSTPTKGNPRKKQCSSLDLNERPLKKPRMRKHTPKIFDESKPQKSPKPKVKPSIPKSRNFKARAKIKKKLEKDWDKVSDDLSEDVYMQTPNSKIPETIPESLVLQASTPQPQILEHAILAISPPDLEHYILRDLGHVSKSCKRSLHFNLENENDVFSVGAAEAIRNHVTHGYNKFLLNPLDSVNEQEVDTNSSISLEDNLEAESTSQPNQGNDAISQNDHKARDKGGSQLDFLENYSTQDNIGTADYAEKGWNALDINTKCKVTSCAKRTGRRKGKKRVTNKRVEIARRDKKSCFTISKRISRRNFEIVNGAKDTCFSTINSGQKGKFRSQFVGKVLPNENQIAAAMAEPESFACVFSLFPMVMSRRKRSIHPKRTKFVCREENTEFEPLSLALTLSPLVMSKRKRSKKCKRSTAILDSLCLKSEISAIIGIESFIDKWSQINSWNAGPLVLQNPLGVITTHKKKDKLKETLPKVDLDMESLRMWNLLIENGGIDEDPDEEKNIWWEKQRKIFKGRVASFIARMRLVLGNRTFSQWKGSVVDSVVGVFLTQNVSDHLSSNAFMLLASAFPLQNKQEMITQQEQALAITQGMQDSFEKDEKDFDAYDSSSRNTSECLQEEIIGNESTCGSQSSVNSCNPEVITFAESCDLGNETGNLPNTISREKNKLPKREIDWDGLRKTYSMGKYSGSTESNGDSVNWEAVSNADVKQIFETIKCRGQGNILASNIKNFLNRLVEDHGSIDLEWLRDVPTDDVKEFLLSIVGLGPKSVDCVKLLSLRHHSFPVDINVARVAVRLGWVPLQPLPDGIQMHLLDSFPLESSIQKYLWPRLCKLDMLTLYELHYHMITFGKVFCTKKKPNCDACPMRAECRHFASAFASTMLRLPGLIKKGEATSKQPDRVDDVPNMHVPLPNLSHSSESFLESSFQTQVCVPIIEMPESPEHRPLESLEQDIEDFPYESEHEQEIPTIKLNTKALGENILNFIDKSNKEYKESMLNFVDEISKLHRDEEVSKALVLLNPKSASHPSRKLKTEGRLRTEHSVYELPDDHPLLSGFEKREPDDHCPYLLAISLTEQVMYKQKKKGKLSSSKELKLYDSEMCPNSTSYSPNDQIVYGTILLPCRTANRGSFPLNGTYFQINEVFADHETSLNPIPVARASIWNLTQRTLYCGTSVASIFRGLSTKDIQYCFWKGFMTIRGYDRKQRAPRPLHDRFHSNKYSEI